MALVAATWLHLGFQAVVTLLVYPGFAAVAPAAWPEVHRTHTRRIGPVVAVVYGALLAAGGWVVLTGTDPAGWVAVLAAGASMAVTATVAGPAHQRLSPDRSAALLRRLLVADRVRLGAALVAAVASVVAAFC